MSAVEWVGLGIGLALLTLSAAFGAVWMVFTLAQVAALGWRLGNLKFDRFQERKKVQNGKPSERA